MPDREGNKAGKGIKRKKTAAERTIRRQETRRENPHATRAKDSPESEANQVLFPTFSRKRKRPDGEISFQPPGRPVPQNLKPNKEKGRFGTQFTKNKTIRFSRSLSDLDGLSEGIEV